jgi:hypothetical protein
MDQIQKEQTAARDNALQDGADAAQILDNRLFRKYYEGLMDDLFHGYLSVSVDDVERMKDIVQMGKAARKFKDYLESCVETANMIREEDR